MISKAFENVMYTTNNLDNYKGGNSLPLLNKVMLLMHHIKQGIEKKEKDQKREASPVADPTPQKKTKRDADDGGAARDSSRRNISVALQNSFRFYSSFSGFRLVVYFSKI
jgi:hypothetical protein